jgi:hypothetical protein
MTDESSGSGSGPGGGRRRRPPSTIELEATEVASEPADTSDRAGPQDSTQSAPEPEPAHVPRSADAQASRQERGNRRSGVWGLIGAGVTGAALTFLIMVGIGMFGLLRPSEGNDEDLSELSDRVGILERQFGALAARSQPGASSERVEEINARVAKLEAGAAAPRPGDPAVTQKIADLERRIEQALAAAGEAKGRAEAAASQAQKADTQTAAGPERGEVDALGTRVTNLEQRFDKTVAGTDRAVRLALVAMELRVAVERGAPFAAELQAAKQLTENPSALAPLETAAANGVPPASALAQNLSKLAPAMLKAASAPRREAGVIERLQASAERLVRIRPVEEAPGDEPSTVVARAELKATRGDIAGALADIERLPEPVRAPAAAWIEAAKARIAAIDAAKKLSANALEALARPPQ